MVYCVLRRHGILKASLFERVEAALATVRPTLAGHGGDAELVEVTGERAVVRFLGACDGCPASALTFYAGVKKAITEQVPEIREVKQAKGLGGGGDAVHFTSPFAVHEKEGWTRASRLADLPDGATRIIELDGHSLLLSRFGDTVTCFENACAHLGMPMDHGDMVDGIITCPHHGFATHSKQVSA
ncbi:NifU family protein [Hankyongella ginsenosidimutans]|uniref:NifU family protein n=1 Tax=Hankyongella ginsenosidimutans TaxID=1763828 RepID=UPI001FE890D5|nr:NifU family protein [Hankyongella ginsenosidimutans]